MHVDLFAPFSHQAQRFSPDDPYERCGFLISRRFGTPISLTEVENVHDEPATHFRITTDQMRLAIRTYSLARHPRRPRSVVGVWHTHPGRGTWEEALPSAHDLAGAVKHPYLIHVLYHPFTRRLTVFSERGIKESFHFKAKWVSKKGT